MLLNQYMYMLRIKYTLLYSFNTMCILFYVHVPVHKLSYPLYGSILCHLNDEAWTGQSLQLHVQWTMNKKIEEVIEQLKTILEEDAKQVWKKEEQGLCHIFGSYHGEVDEVRQMATAYKGTCMHDY